MSLSSPTTAFLGLSPSRDTPNVHPYAIKTSSSAVLTRSNSTGLHDNTSHHYSPLAPTNGHVQSKPSRLVLSHRHTRSLPSVNGDLFEKPSPVPVPPPPLSARLAPLDHSNGAPATGIDGEGIPPTPPMTWRVKRRNTLPSVHPNSDTEASVQDLPKNPKLWTPAQLSVYLSSALRLKGGAKPPVPVANDIGIFVMKERLSGRAFLRMKKEEYDAFSINQLWKDALFEASRALRQTLVQGRIMNFKSPSQSSLSAKELLLVQEEDDDSFIAEPPTYSLLDPSRRRSSSSTSLQWEEDKKRMSKTTFRAGRVRGMVETYERSFSQSSESGSDGEDCENGPAKFGPGQLVSEPVDDEADLASGEDSSASENEGDKSMVPAFEVGGDNNSACAGSDKAQSKDASVNVAEDLPSIETLLREQEESGLRGGQYQSWGARAWEDEVMHPTSVHDTAKRVPFDTDNIAGEGAHLTANDAPDVPLIVDHAPKSLAGLFAPPAVHETPPLPDVTRDVGATADQGEPNSKVTLVVVSNLKLREALKTFQERLETVERRLDEMECLDREKDKLLQQAQNAEAWPLPQDEASRDFAIRPSSIDIEPQFAPSGPHPSDVEEESKETQRSFNDYFMEDPTLAGLPRYMFLISLGVAAVTMRVVLKRMIGDRRRA